MNASCGVFWMMGLAICWCTKGQIASLEILSSTRTSLLKQGRLLLWTGIVRLNSQKYRDSHPANSNHFHWLLEKIINIDLMFSFHFIAKLHVIHGGRDINNDRKMASIFTGFSGICKETLPDLPLPLSSMGYAYGDDSIFICGGTSGGAKQGILFLLISLLSFPAKSRGVSAQGPERKVNDIFN